MAIDEHAHERVGTLLDHKYTLHRLIGCGGMATVYEASHRNGHRVAVKILHPDLANHHDFRDRFLREGYVANKVEHPGAVRVLDDDVAEDGAVFLVMELLEGGTLDERCKQAGGILPVREVCVHAYRLLEVLAAAHAKGVVHRDIKPENVFLTAQGELKVLDFGIARLLEATEPRRATRTGAMLGTPAFMAPEQALGHVSEVDGRSDLWSVAATMFALVSGRLVHEAETIQEMMVRAGSEQARSVRSVAPHTPPRIADVIDTALAFRTLDRWPDASSMASSLRDAYESTFGASIAVEALFPLPSTRPASAPPIAGSAPVVARMMAPRTAAPFSTTINSEGNRPWPPRRSLARTLAFTLFALSSVVVGIIVASRKDSATNLETPVSTLPAATIAAPLAGPTPTEEVVAPRPSVAVPESAAASEAAVREADAAPIDRDASSAVTVVRSSAPAPSAVPAATVLRRSAVVVPPEPPPVMKPVEPPVAPAPVAPAPVAPAPVAPVPAAPAAPSATTPSEPASDPTFGI